MTALYSFSEMIGKAIGLPEVFYRPITLPNFREASILPALRLGNSRRTRADRAARVRRRKGKGARDSMGRPLVLEGQVGQGSATKFSIDNTDFVVTPGTWIIGELRAGCSARVKGAKNAAGQLEAASVVMIGL